MGSILAFLISIYLIFPECQSTKSSHLELPQTAAVLLMEKMMENYDDIEYRNTYIYIQLLSKAQCVMSEKLLKFNKVFWS